jgi:hypothetical protein
MGRLRPISAPSPSRSSAWGRSRSSSSAARQLEEPLVERLRDEVGRAALDGVDGGGDRPEGGHDHDRLLGGQRLDLVEEVEPRPAREADVGEHDVEPAGREAGPRLLGVAHELGLPAPLLEQLVEQRAHDLLVLDHQDARHVRDPTQGFPRERR